jgi:hypothetical protein
MNFKFQGPQVNCCNITILIHLRLTCDGSGARITKMLLELLGQRLCGPQTEHMGHLDLWAKYLLTSKVVIQSLPFQKAPGPLRKWVHNPLLRVLQTQGR